MCTWMAVEVVLNYMQLYTYDDRLWLFNGIFHYCRIIGYFIELSQVRLLHRRLLMRVLCQILLFEYSHDGITICRLHFLNSIFAVRTSSLGSVRA